MTGVICLSLQTMQPAPIPTACVLCLGNFDGVHIAHRALLNTAKNLRAHRFPDAVCGVFCFDPPSSDFFGTGEPAHLASLSEKLSYFRDEGAEYAFLADFSALRDMSAEQFATEILKDYCHCVAAVCGFNFRFGHKGAGEPSLLKSLLGIPVEVKAEIQADGKTVSSSRIRTLLRNGRPEEAAALLNRPYSIRSEVLHGKALGRKWGFPTINQAFPEGMLIPRHGVYITDCTLPDGSHRRGISNVGIHPTVDQNATINCETHLLDFDGDLYGDEITVSFLHFIRPEMKFETQKALQEQIERDLESAKKY